MAIIIKTAKNKKALNISLCVQGIHEFSLFEMRETLIEFLCNTNIILAVLVETE